MKLQLEISKKKSVGCDNWSSWMNLHCGDKWDGDKLKIWICEICRHRMLQHKQTCQDWLEFLNDCRIDDWNIEEQGKILDLQESIKFYDEKEAGK